MARCLTPMAVRVKAPSVSGGALPLYESDQTIPVPCGRCPMCRARRISSWSFRLMQEEKYSDSSAFITLTYDENTVPRTPSGHLVFNKRDPQLFLKRLRKSQDKWLRENYGSNYCRPIRYYLVSEYGEHTFRPHYHVLLFNANVELVTAAWGLGHVHFGHVSAASVGYSLKYMSKDSRVPAYTGDDRPKEFALMSKGLGKDYLTDKMVAWHRADLYNRMYVNLDAGKKAAMPRYYKDRIYSKVDRKMVGAYMSVVEEQRILDNPLNDVDRWNLVEDLKAAFAKMHAVSPVITSFL